MTQNCNHTEWNYIVRGLWDVAMKALTLFWAMFSENWDGENIGEMFEYNRFGIFKLIPLWCIIAYCWIDWFFLFKIKLTQIGQFVSAC